eukprot:m.21779 g.21779  ORF g.21779 m.21779 type:complete len:482 (+) comp8141_c0_seq1:107-1552(+)
MMKKSLFSLIFLALVLAPVCALGLKARDARVDFQKTTLLRAAAAAATAASEAASTLSSSPSSLLDDLKNGNSSGTNVLASKLDSAVQSLRHSNWTVLMLDLRDPDTQPYLSAFGMVLSLIICFYGHRSLLVWLSLLGFITFFLLVYVFAPIAFESDLCCEPEKQQTLLAISGVAGAVGAILAIWAYRVGLALAGGGAGLSLAMAARPVLESAHLLRADTDFVVACAVFSAVGAVCALLKPKPLVVLGTSVVGAFGFAAGVGTFEHCHFVETVVLVHNTYTHGGPGPLPTCDTALLAVWGALSVLGIVVQYGIARKCKKKRASQSNPSNSDDCARPDRAASSSSLAATGGSSATSLLPVSNQGLRSGAPGRARAVPTLPPMALATVAESSDDLGQTRSVRRYIRRRLAEVLAEARRLRMRITDDSDSESDEPAPRRTRGRGAYRKLRTSTTASDGSSEAEDPSRPPRPQQPPRRGRVGATDV